MENIKKILIFTFLIGIQFHSNVLFAQNEPLKGDASIYTKYLLTSMVTQIEATQAVNDLYNFKFEKAEKQFRWIKQKYPKHPMPYFLLGFSEWWKIMPIDNGSGKSTKYDKKFISYMDSSIKFAELLYEEDPKNIDALFFLSASYGFLGRIYSDRKQYAKATWAGRNALNYLKEGSEYLDISPELLFGEALYNYYAEWVKENYVLLRPVLMFFPDGDKEKGLEQLRKVSINAFYTRTEAQFFRMKILAYEENDKEGAHYIAQYLEESFPDNSYFQRFYAQSCFNRGEFKEAERVSKEILAKLDSNYAGYEPTAGRYAGYFLGYINQNRFKNDKKAKLYYELAINYAEKNGAKESSYYHYSVLNIARISAKEGDNVNAKKHYKLYKKIGSKKSAGYKEAKKYLKNN